MRTARALVLLVGMALVLLTACNAPSLNLAPTAPTDTRVVVGFANIGGTGGLEALDVTTGHLLWKTQLGGSISYLPSQPTIENGVVYAITQDPSYVTRVVAVRESDGKLLWRGPLVGSMTVDESAIAVTETSLYVLDPATGVERWHEDIRGCFGAQPWPEPTPRGDRRHDAAHGVKVALMPERLFPGQ